MAGRDGVQIIPVKMPPPAIVGPGHTTSKYKDDTPEPGTPTYSGLSEILGGAGGEGLTRDKAGREVTVAALNAPLAPTFGRDRVGCRLYDGIYSGGYLYLVYIVGPGPISAYNSIEIGGKPLTGAGSWGLTANVDFKTYLGTAAQGVDATLHAARASWIQRLQRIAYFWIRVPQQTYATTGFDPLNVVADINGLLVRNYSLDNTLVNRYFNHSPIWAAAEIITNNWWGMGRGRSSPDATVDWPNFATAAGICATDIGGGELRFQFDLTMLDIADAESWMAQLRASCDAWFVREQGVWRVFIDRPRTATGIRFYDSAKAGATAGTSVVDRMEVTGASPHDRFNRIILAWVDATDGFKDKEIIIEHPYVTQKIWPARPLRLEVRSVRKLSQVNRIGVHALNRALLWRKYRLTAQQAAERLSINDAFNVTGFGYADLGLVLVNFSPVLPGGHTIELLAEPSDNSIFTDAQLTDPSPIALALPDANSRPAAPTGVSVTPKALQTIEGVIEQTYLVAWTPWPDPAFYYRTHIYVDDGVTTKWVGAPVDSPYEIRVLALRQLHSVSLFTESKAGSLSVAATVQFIPDNPTDNPVYSAGGSGTGTSRGAPTVIPLDASTVQTYDTHALNASVTGYFGGCFDGRYVYTNGRAGAGIHGRMMQFDTTKALSDSTAYVFRDGGVDTGGLGCIFDGRYVYFTMVNTIQRFDTQNPLGFGDASAWESYQRDAGDSFSGGCAFDDFNLYFGGVNNAKLVRFAAKAADGTRNAFTTAGNWSVYDLSGKDAAFAAQTFRALGYDGAFIYAAPENAGTGKMARLNKLASFTAAGSWTVLDLTAMWASAGKFHGMLYDGRFLWTVDANTSGYQYLRFDTTRAFSDKGGWDNFPPPTATYPWALVFDGRYLYFIGAKMIRYDTFAQFKNADSYQLLDPTTIDANMTDFSGAAWDRKWVYMFPRNISAAIGKLLRHPASNAIVLPPTRPAVDGTTAILRAQEFTADGSWTAPLTIKNNEVWITAVAGGGGGGGCPATASSGAGGGGAGGYCYRKRLVVSPGTTYTITIGNGGAGHSGADGSAGTGTSFGALLTLFGGGGGVSTGAGGSGGSPGGAGGADWGQSGAASPLGDGGGAGYNGSGGNGGYGAGGGGTYTQTNVARRGGDGGDGYMLIEWNE